jgi:putative ABC transport system permease protein
VFVALRDIRFARGRFALMGAVVALITTLVVFLYGLTGGLAQAASSAVTQLPADAIVFGAPAGGDPTVSFSSSTVTATQAAAWAATPGVTSAQPLGVAMTRLTGPGGAGAVSLFGGSARLLPAPVRDGQVVLSAEAARRYRAVVGQGVTLGAQRLTVSGIGPDRSYAHAPTVWTTSATWRLITGQREPTVLAITGHPAAGAPKVPGTTAVPPAAALAGIDGYSAEQGSLQLIQGFLFAVSALVTGAFFTVWTVQRGGDIAVLKAVGASSGYLVRDALAQAFAVLAAGAALGGAFGAAGGALAAASVPFAVGPATVAVPVAVMIALGLAGSALTVRRITSVDPLTALGAGR